MTNLKQIGIDFAVVLGLPLLVVYGYYYYVTSSGAPFFVTEQGPEDSKTTQIGATVKSKLNELKSIRIDDSLFQDPAYLSLVEYPVDTGTTTFGRPYPFSPTPEIEQVIISAEKAGLIAQ